MINISATTVFDIPALIYPSLCSIHFERFDSVHSLSTEANENSCLDN